MSICVLCVLPKHDQGQAQQNILCIYIISYGNIDCHKHAFVVVCLCKQRSTKQYGIKTRRVKSIYCITSIKCYYVRYGRVKISIYGCSFSKLIISISPKMNRSHAALCCCLFHCYYYYWCIIVRSIANIFYNHIFFSYCFVWLVWFFGWRGIQHFVSLMSRFVFS